MKQKRLGKKIAAWFMCLAMVLTTVNLPVFTKEVKAEEAPKCGENAYYAYDETTKTLRIYGSGSLYNNAFNVNYSAATTFNDDERRALIARNMKKVIIGNDITSIGTSAFYGFGYKDDATSSQLETVEFEEGSKITDIGTNAFYCCKSLSSFSMPDSVKTLGTHAFNSCYSLASVTLSNNLETIGKNAFESCNKLENVVIPPSVTTIEGSAFAHCDNLLNISIANPLVKIGVDSLGGYKLKNVHVSCSFDADTVGDGEEEEKASSYWSRKGVYNTSIVKKDIHDFTSYKCLDSEKHTEKCSDCGEAGEQGNHNFSDNGTCVCGLTQVKCEVYDEDDKTAIAIGLNDGVTAKGDLLIPSVVNIDGDNYTVTVIGQDAFAGCEFDGKLIIPNTVTWIRERAFAGTDFVGEVAIPDSVDFTGICEEIFKGCNNITLLTFPCSIDYSFVLDLIGISNDKLKQRDHVFSTDEDVRCKVCHGCRSYLTTGVHNVDGQPYVDIEGYGHYRQCVDCDDYDDGEEHTFISEVKVELEGQCKKEETCTVVGEYYKYCPVCDALSTETFEVPATGNHDFSESEGNKSEKCKLCNVNNIAYEGITVDGLELTYTEEAQSPKLTLKDKDGKAINTDEYDITVTPATATKVGDTCKVTITGKKNYAGERIETVTVKKAIPNVEAPTGLSVSCNSVLSDDILPNGFSFDDKEAKLTVGADNELSATYTPDDTDNYEVVKDIKVVVTVKDHNYNAEIVADAYKQSDATCKNKAVYFKSCSVCGAKGTETFDAGELAPANHKGETEIKDQKEASCTEAGYSGDTYCEDCGAELVSGKDIEKKAHTPAEMVKENVVEATTEADGSYDEVIRCNVCNTIISSKTITVPKIIPEHTHAIVKIEAKAATCEKAGNVQYYYCDGCKRYFEDAEGKSAISLTDTVVAAKGHTPAEMVKENIVEATETENGSYDEVVYCSVCEAEISRNTVTITADGHSVKEYPAKEATCTVSGNDLYYYCSSCDKYYNDKSCDTEHEVDPADVVIQAKGHTEEVLPAVAATCKAAGLTAGKKCSVCGEILQEQTVINATGHAKDNGTITVAPTCKEKGKKVYKCSVCTADLEEEEIAAKGHTEVKLEAKAATCTEAGLTEGKKCSVCNTVTNAQTKIDAKGHTVVTDKAIAATCETDGKTEGSHCSVCNAVIKAQEVVKATGHVNKEVKNATTPTYLEEGYTGDEYCLDCGKKLSTGKVIPKEVLPVGESAEDEKKTGNYEITTSTDGKKEVSFDAPADKTQKTVSVPATVTIGDTTYKVTKVDDNAFKGNKKVTKVTLGSNITEIGKDAFSGANKLTTVTVGKNVEAIGNNAFKGCSSLKSVSLGTKVNKIGSNAFNGCKKMKTLTIKATKLTSKNVSKNAFKGITKGTTIKVPKKKLKAYKKLFKSKGLSSKVKVVAY